MPSQGLDSIETASIDELRALQLRRLQSITRHAYDNSKAYREKFEARGVHPDHIKSLEDITLLPFTEKKDLREHYPFGMVCVPMKEVVRIHASSGTTGKPTVVAYTKSDINDWARVMARSIYAAGGRANDKVHVAYGYGLFTGGLGAHYGAELLGCTVIPMSGGQTARQVQLIQDFDPDLIMVTPSYMLNIADEMYRQKVDVKKLSLRCGLFGAEPWTEPMRKALEDRLEIDATDIYGLSEVIGPGVAQECVNSKDGLTIWEDYFFPEIINPSSGEALADGEYGELVFTTLTKQALPVIRYRTRDLTRLLPGTDRTMRRMDKITGRSDDMLIMRGVNVFPSQIEEQVLALPELSPHYHIEVERRGNMDEMSVSVEARPNNNNSKPEHLAKQLSENIKSFIGISVLVKVLPDGTLARSEGKAKRVTDNRPK